MQHVISGLQRILEQILQAHPDGLNEYDMLIALGEQGVDIFNEDYFRSPVGLFQRHFLLFHCLYLLRNTWRTQQSADLAIHCLGIRRLPYMPASPALTLADPLASYYLDLDNLDRTGEAEVLAMLEGFWRRFAGTEERDEALAVLALQHPTSLPAIRRSYRQLAMQWHPDRGGSTPQFQRLEWAMAVLRRYYAE